MTSIFRWLSYCYSLFSGSNCRGQIEYVIRNVILSFSFSFSTKTTQHDKTFEIRYLIHYTKSNYISNMINVCRLDSFFFSFFWLYVWGLYIWCCWRRRHQYCRCCCCPFVRIFAWTELQKVELFRNELQHSTFFPRFLVVPLIFNSMIFSHCWIELSF